MSEANIAATQAQQAGDLIDRLRASAAEWLPTSDHTLRAWLLLTEAADALAATKAEPVAWLHPTHGHMQRRTDNMTPEIVEAYRKNRWTLLYAAPVATAKPLTDERLRQMHHEDEFGLYCDDDEFLDIARTVESECARAWGVKLEGIGASTGGKP